MTENQEKSVRTRQPNLVVLQVLDKEGNPILGLKNENIKVIEVTKKLSMDLYNKIQETPGAFIAKI